MAATKHWEVKFNRAYDDTGTTLMPDEIQIPDNSVEFMTGSGEYRVIRLASPVENLSPEDIQVKRHRSEFFENLNWKAESANPM